MSDITVTFSRYRLTYQPSGGEPVVLLDWGDLMSDHPQWDGSPVTQTDEIIMSDWVSHHARGNASLHLSWDCYGRAADLASAQCIGLQVFLALMTHPEGTLRVQTGWQDDGTPAIDWTFHATLDACAHAELDEETSPFADAAGMLLSYTFTLTDPAKKHE